MIEVKNLRKSFKDLDVLKGVSFDVSKGDVVAAIGPSGSGKSTLLRCVIDLEKADSGDIIIEGAYLSNNGTYPSEKDIGAIRSKMGMVFQHFNLFPHMSVKENLCIAPTLSKKYAKEDITDLCVEMLAKVGLKEKINEYPSKLSGGQKQRVAIARALMLNPDIMLFDEPTSSLDPELTGEVLQVIRELAKEHMTMVIVTHEIGFAREAANNVIFMDNGVILDAGSPEKVIQNPENERVKMFLDKVL